MKKTKKQRKAKSKDKAFFYKCVFTTSEQAFENADDIIKRWELSAKKAAQIAIDHLEKGNIEAWREARSQFGHLIAIVQDMIEIKNKTHPPLYREWKLDKPKVSKIKNKE